MGPCHGEAVEMRSGGIRGAFRSSGRRAESVAPGRLDDAMIRRVGIAARRPETNALLERRRSQRGHF